jgi:hypothetical protein
MADEERVTEERRFTLRITWREYQEWIETSRRKRVKLRFDHGQYWLSVPEILGLNDPLSCSQFADVLEPYAKVGLLPEPAGNTLRMTAQLLRELDITPTKDQWARRAFADFVTESILQFDGWEGHDTKPVASEPTSQEMLVNPIWRGRDFAVSQDLCFVLMPFSASWSREIWEERLKPIIEGCGLRAERADDFTGHDVMEDVWKGLNEAQVVVADITGKNPNVFYELGIAHTLGKNIILVTQNLSEVPFDVNRYRIIEYEAGGYDKLKEQLMRFLSALLAELRS